MRYKTHTKLYTLTYVPDIMNAKLKALKKLRPDLPIIDIKIVRIIHFMASVIVYPMAAQINLT